TVNTSGGGDPDCTTATGEGCDTSTPPTPVNTGVALTTTKPVSPNPMTVGVAATYTLTVTTTGTGPTTADWVSVENVDASLTINSVGAGGAQSGQTVTCTTPAGLAAGASATYTITVTNNGTGPTTADTVSVDNVDASLTINSVGAGCAQSGQTVTCTTPAGLAAGASATYTINVTPTAANSTGIVNTVNTSGGGDPACTTAGGEGCDATTPPVPVNSGVDLTTSKTVAPNPMTVGVAATYTITVTNNGTGPTTADTVSVDAVDASLTINSVGAGCTQSGQTVTCTTPAGLAAGASATYTINVTPTAANSAGIVNTVNTSGGGDPDCTTAAGEGCDTSTPPTPVNTGVALTTTKTVAPNPMTVGVAATYT
ncbi:DUF11 domain-containing protein, partial [Luteimonas aquatica]|uniref:DUF11 domain-containing protein n=1 Tax=Luteimonas aquatica TaxID=450364 RepID=UPI001F58F86A